MSSEKYHYEPGAIHYDHHKEINIGSVPERALGEIIKNFFKDDVEDAEFEELKDSEVEQTAQNFPESILDCIFHRAINVAKVKKTIADIIIMKGEEGKFRLTLKQAFILHKVLEEIDWLDDDTDTTFIQWFDDVFKWPWETRNFKSVKAGFKHSHSMTWDENTVNDPGTGREYRQFADYVRNQFVDIGQDGTIKDKVEFMKLGSDGKPMYIGHGSKRK